MYNSHIDGKIFHLLQYLHLNMVIRQLFSTYFFNIAITWKMSWSFG